MLNTKHINKVMKSTLRINPDIAYGLAVKQSMEIEQYVHDVIRCASASFPPGLRYMGYRRATPDEQLRDLCRLRRKKRIHELAKSDLYHCLYNFEYTDPETGFTKKLKPRYIQLPYVRQGGIVRVRGSSYVISPVLADNIFSIDKQKIFMPVTRSKITFFKENYAYLKNGNVESVDIVYAPIFNIQKAKKHKKRQSMLMHYILAKHGLEDGMKRYFSVDIVMGTRETITPRQYPTDKYVICSSRNIAPASMVGSQMGQILNVDICFAIPLEQWNYGVSAAMGGVFYIIDNEHPMFEVDPNAAADSAHFKPEDMRRALLWRRLLPRFIKRTVELEHKAMEEMEAHIKSLDNYIDDLVRIKLQKEGVPCEDIYDIFAYMIKNFSAMTANSQPANMFGKQLETTRFIMFDVVSKIFTLMFELVKLKGDRLSERSIEQTFDRLFPTYAVEAINRGHGEVETLNSATDCLPLGVTRTIAPQSRVTTMAKRSKQNEINDPTFALDSSQTMVATYLFITKSEPSARTAVNHFLKLGPGGEVVFEEEYKEELETLNMLFQL